MKTTMMILLLLTSVSIADAKTKQNIGITYIYHESRTTIPGESNDSDGEPRSGLGFEHSLQLNDRLALGYEIAVLVRHGEKSTRLINNVITTASGDTTTLMLMGKYGVGRVFKPYIGGGVGAGFYRLLLKGKTADGSPWAATGTTDERTLIESRQVSMGATARAGVDFVVKKGVLLGFEAGYYKFGKITHDLTPAGAAVLGGNRSMDITPIGVTMSGRFSLQF